MKKWITGILIFAVIISVATYFLIPSTLLISNVIACKTSLPGTLRTLMVNSQWRKWWINKASADKGIYEYKGDNYQLASTYTNGAVINIKHNNENIKSDITLLDMPYDSVLIEWKWTINASLNPFERIRQYNEAVTLKNNTRDILTHLKKFIENGDNIYGIPIKLSSIEHIFMITTKTLFDHNPSTSEVYNSINFLKQFANGHSLQQTYYPMMNVTKNNDTAYRLMVALPVNKETNFTGNVHSVRMVQGNFMVTEVKGGYATINNALDQMQLYFDDYQKTAMAIPFQYIVTDRMKEPDTSKWITKIYAPVQ